MPAPAGGPDLDTIERWLSEARARAQAIQDLLDPLEQERASLQNRISLLLSLRATLAPPAIEPLSDVGVSPSAPSRAAGSTEGLPAAVDVDRSSAPGSGVESTRSRVQRQVREILEEAVENKLHINEIHRAFLERGWAVPGAGRAANITVHLSTASGVYSPTRGWYAIGDDERKPRKRSPTRKRRPPAKRSRTDA